MVAESKNRLTDQFPCVIRESHVPYIVIDRLFYFWFDSTGENMAEYLKHRQFIPVIIFPSKVSKSIGLILFSFGEITTHKLSAKTKRTIIIDLSYIRKK